jgi:hypothetical protein
MVSCNGFVHSSSGVSRAGRRSARNRPLLNVGDRHPVLESEFQTIVYCQKVSVLLQRTAATAVADTQKGARPE